MGVVAELFSSINPFKRARIDGKINYIFYKIVDFDGSQYVLQCINTRAIFRYNIVSLVQDIDILYGLHPSQACFIGIEFAKYFKNNRQKELKMDKRF